LDAIVSIPEGNLNKPLSNKEIVPLLTELKQTMGLMEQTLPPEFAQNMARMPQGGENTFEPQRPEILAGHSKILCGKPCPPGNVNGGHPNPLTADQLPPAQPSAEAMPLNAQTAAANGAHARGEPQAKEHDNAPPQAEGHGSALLQAKEHGRALYQAKERGSTLPQTEGRGNATPQAEERGRALPQGASFDIAPPRLAFAERFGAAATQSGTRPLTAGNLFAAMIERIVSLPEAAPHLEISLKPDHLGKLLIDLRLSENGLNAKILANDEGVRNLLASQINRLSDSLAERGIRLESIEVVYTALSDKDFGRQQPENREAWENARQENGRNKPVESIAAACEDNFCDLPLWADDTGWGLNSVEYLA
jgi:hypothetical protein